MWNHLNRVYRVRPADGWHPENSSAWDRVKSFRKQQFSFYLLQNQMWNPVVAISVFADLGGLIYQPLPALLCASYFESIESMRITQWNHVSAALTLSKIQRNLLNSIIYSSQPKPNVAVFHFFTLGLKFLRIVFLKWVFSNRNILSEALYKYSIFHQQRRQQSDWGNQWELLEVLYSFKLGCLFRYLYMDLCACH